MLGGLVWNFASPVHGFSLAALLQNSSMTLPRVVVKPFRSEFYVWLLILIGLVAHVRDGGSVSNSGMSAMKSTFLAGLPITVAGALMLSGILKIVPTLHSLDIMLAPLFALPQCCIWGAVGGWLGRRIAPYIRSRALR